jgi:hypothetical protein
VSLAPDEHVIVLLVEVVLLVTLFSDGLQVEDGPHGHRRVRLDRTAHAIVGRVTTVPTQAALSGSRRVWRCNHAPTSVHRQGPIA